jgi:hypothetical protein
VHALSVAIRRCFIALVFLVSCHHDPKIAHENEVAFAWAKLTLEITRNTPANSPTYASRCLGYIGLAMYESIVPSDPSYNSMSNQLNGLGAMPRADAGEYNWVLSLNAAQALIVKSLYDQTSDENKAKIDSLELLVLTQFSDGVPNETVSRSIGFGREVAKQIFEWSRNDGGHRGYLANFDRKLRMPTEQGCWEPPLYAQSFSHFPLHPHWGKNRTFAPSNALLETPGLLKFDSSKLSSYRRLFIEVYDKNKVLTQEEKEVALWWGDDPGDTFTPPGHSYYLAMKVLMKADASLMQCGEAFARVGMAVADAFVTCWKWKYIYSSERPSSFISKCVDPRWESFWPDPPFPAFPSGHATQAGAVAEVLTHLYGPSFEFEDDAHAGRPKDELRNVEFKTRRYSSFWQVAEETAMSRFYGGIHTKLDNDVGLREGKKIGANVNQLSWRNVDVVANHKKRTP